MTARTLYVLATVIVAVVLLVTLVETGRGVLKWRSGGQGT